MLLITTNIRQSPTLVKHLIEKLLKDIRKYEALHELLKGPIKFC